MTNKTDDDDDERWRDTDLVPIPDLHELERAVARFPSRPGGEKIVLEAAALLTHLHGQTRPAEPECRQRPHHRARLRPLAARGYTLLRTGWRSICTWTASSTGRLRRAS